MTGDRNSGAQTEKRLRSIHLQERADGRTDVFFNAKVYPEHLNGVTDYDVSIMIARGIDPEDYGGPEGLKNHILANWESWKEIAEVVWL